MKIKKSVLFSILALLSLVFAMSCSNPYTPEDPIINITEETTVKHDVSFSLGKLDLENLSAPNAQINIPENIKALEPTIRALPAGYIIEGWYTDDSYTTKWNFNEVVSETMTLYPKYLVNVTYSEGALKTDYDNKSVYIELGTNAEVPSVSLPAGYKLEGWYTDSSFTTKWDFNNAVNEPMTLYPKYLATVSYSGGALGSSQQKAPVDVVLGNSVNAPELSLPTGYKLEGWYTDSSLTTKWNFNNAVNEPMTLYPKYLVCVTFSTGEHGANQSRNPVYVQLGTAIGASNVKLLSREAPWTCTGWNDSNNQAVTASTIINSPITITAQWVYYLEPVGVKNMSVYKTGQRLDYTIHVKWDQIKDTKIKGYKIFVEVTGQQHLTKELTDDRPEANGMSIRVKDVRYGTVTYTVTPRLDESETVGKRAVSVSGSCDF